MSFIEGCSLVIIAGIVIGSLVVLPAVHFSSVHEGEHAGYVTAIEQEGYFFPNYHVYFKTDNSSSQEDKYCLNRKHADIAEKLKAYNQSRQQVLLRFAGVRGFGYGLCAGEEIIGVEAKQ